MRSATSWAAIFAAVSLATSSSAYAHGLGLIVQPLVIAAAVTGLVGGAIAGATDSHPGVGVGVTIGVAVVLALGYLAWELPAAEFLDAVLFALVLIAFAGVIPLTITFFVAFGLAAVIRARVLKKGQAL